MNVALVVVLSLVGGSEAVQINASSLCSMTSLQLKAFPAKMGDPVAFGGEIVNVDAAHNIGKEGFAVVIINLKSGDARCQVIGAAFVLEQEAASLRIGEVIWVSSHFLTWTEKKCAMVGASRFCQYQFLVTNDSGILERVKM